MTPQTIGLIKSSFAHVVPIADETAKLFYDRLFAASPELRVLFADDMAEQRRKLMLTLASVVYDLDQLDRILPAIEDLARRHVGYGVRDEHYGPVGDALLWALGEGLGGRFTPQVGAAWAEAYGVLAETMIAATRPQ